MGARDLKEKFFSSFIEWLDKKGYGDHFSLDVWMVKVWEVLYTQYIKEIEEQNNMFKTIQKMSTPALKSIVKEREGQEEKAKKDNVIAMKKSLKNIN